MARVDLAWKAFKIALRKIRLTAVAVAVVIGVYVWISGLTGFSAYLLGILPSFAAYLVDKFEIAYEELLRSAPKERTPPSAPSSKERTAPHALAPTPRPRAKRSYRWLWVSLAITIGLWGLFQAYVWLVYNR